MLPCGVGGTAARANLPSAAGPMRNNVVDTSPAAAGAALTGADGATAAAGVVAAGADAGADAGGATAGTAAGAAGGEADGVAGRISQTFAPFTGLAAVDNCHAPAS